MEVACNLAPFAAASNNNLNPIMEQATLELESSDDSNEEMPTVLEPQVHSGTFCPLYVQSFLLLWIFFLKSCTGVLLRAVLTGHGHPTLFSRNWLIG